MTFEEYLEQFKRSVLDLSEVNGSFYIALDGAFLTVPTRSNILTALQEQGIKTEDGLDYSQVLFNRGYIKGSTLIPRYIQLTDLKPTKEQQDSLLAVFTAMDGSLYIELPDKASINVYKSSPEVILGAVLSVYKK